MLIIATYIMHVYGYGIGLAITKHPWVHAYFINQVAPYIYS